MGSNSSRTARRGNTQTEWENEVAEQLHAGREAGSMGSLGFMSPELFDHLLTYLVAEDLARLSMTNHFFKAVLDGRGYGWRWFYIRSPYFDKELYSECAERHGYDWKALHVKNTKMGWRFDSSHLRCGEAIVLSKDRLRARVDKSYKGPAVIQRVLTERGVSRGRHQFSVKIEGISPGASFGVCPGRHHPPHGYHINSIGMAVGDGTLDIIEGTHIVSEGRIKQRVITGEVVTIDLDLDQHKVSFYVEGTKWVTVENLPVGLWYFYVSVENYPNPLLNKDEGQVYSVVGTPGNMRLEDEDGA